MSLSTHNEVLTSLWGTAQRHCITHAMGVLCFPDAHLSLFCMCCTEYAEKHLKSCPPPAAVFVSSLRLPHGAPIGSLGEKSYYFLGGSIKWFEEAKVVCVCCGGGSSYSQVSLCAEVTNRKELACPWEAKQPPPPSHHVCDRKSSCCSPANTRALQCVDGLWVVPVQPLFSSVALKLPCANQHCESGLCGQ